MNAVAGADYGDNATAARILVPSSYKYSVTNIDVFQTHTELSAEDASQMHKNRM